MKEKHIINSRLPRTEGFAQFLGDGGKFQGGANLLVVLVTSTAGNAIGPVRSPSFGKLSVDALTVLQFHHRKPVTESTDQVERMVL